MSKLLVQFVTWDVFEIIRNFRVTLTNHRDAISKDRLSWSRTAVQRKLVP